MSKYRNKSEIVEAFRYCGPRMTIDFKTPQGDTITWIGDWVVTKENGEQHIVEDALFHKIYKLVQNND